MQTKPFLKSVGLAKSLHLANTSIFIAARGYVRVQKINRVKGRIRRIVGTLDTEMLKLEGT